MIVGITHDQNGHVVQRLSVATKVSIGLPPDGERSHPVQLDHFTFLRKNMSCNGLRWEVDPRLTDHYGDQCRELPIVLIDDDIENVFPSSYAWWTDKERKCWGDGVRATRRTKERPGGQVWTRCGPGCPQLAFGLCKPSGDLRFVLEDFPQLGSICRIHTSSYRSIRQIHSALDEIRTVTGGRLAGISAKLMVRPEEATYFDRKEKRKKTSLTWALSLEAKADDMRKLVSNLTESALLFAETRKMLGVGDRVLQVVEEEPEQARELSAEFYPDAVNDTRMERQFLPVPTVASISSLAQPSATKQASSSVANPRSLENNESGTDVGFYHLRNNFLTAARQFATANNQPMEHVVEWASGGSFSYRDILRMTQADSPKLLSATALMASAAAV